ncbi:methylase (plasmid) [Bacillaceae bacterium JMAK1]|nr:methylase [Bacillaceae bacterium JMAK1]
MTTLSWNEIRSRAIAFANEWKNESSEHAEAKSFWDQFFHVFGVSRRRVATFEERVNMQEGHGYVDLLWRSKLLVEHKSKGRDLDKAYNQARDYFPGIRESDLPQYILVSDFENFRLYDLDNGGERNFRLDQLPQNIELFGFMAGYQKQEITERDPVNIQAAEQMAILHDKLKTVGYTGHDLEVYLVRLLFCLFADDTGIFDKNYFRDYLLHETKEDGSDLGIHISQIYQLLNTSVDKRQSNLNESLQGFPYVNGRLFEEQLRIANFDREMRELLLDTSKMDWGKISPAVFGSLFQNVMNPDARRTLGAHYTSEENIMKVIKPLFLDELWAKFKSIKGNQKRVRSFHEDLSKLTFFDPACGCGNFLIITYREIRMLEKEIIRDLLDDRILLNIDDMVRIDVDQFYGIEIEDFSAQVTQVAMWIIDHQMNMMISEEFGQYMIRLPLRRSPNVVHGNALLLDWGKEVLKGREASYIFGNPPFVGSSYMTPEQKSDAKHIFKSIGVPTGQLDFVAAWFIKAVDVIQGTKTRVAFVGTNSIVQGQQANTLWKYILKRKGMVIEFAHQTFRWNSEAKGKAVVYCVIVGFSKDRHRKKHLFTYPDINGEPTLVSARNINHYLVDAETIIIQKINDTLSDVPKMIKGSSPVDNGNYLFNEDEMIDFINKEPLSEKYFRKWIGASELINDRRRYCLYLKYCPPNELQRMPKVKELMEAVRAFRLKSTKKATVRWAQYPREFPENRVSEDDFLVIPRVTSENREYVPIGYFTSDSICSDSAFQIPNATPYIFGILNSSMHMAWVRTIAGRLKGDYRYSNTLVYNTFPFPEPTDKQVKEIEKHVGIILDVRNEYFEQGNTLAHLYDPIAMPQKLRKVHIALNNAVDRSYGFRKEKMDEKRMEFLIDRYVELNQGE